MMRKLIIFLIVVLMLAMPVLADAGNISASRAVTANGPFNLLVSLGIETLLPIEYSAMFYNWIAVAMLFFIMSMASQRNMRFFCVFIPFFAALVTWFGWLNSGDVAKQLAIIIGAGVLAIGIYMKDTNKEKWGSGGPGSTLINFVVFMILLQACVGLVNTTEIWDNDQAPTPSQYQNVDLEDQMNGINTGTGLWNVGVSAATLLVEAGIMLLKTILSIILTIAAFTVTLYFIYPYIASSYVAIAILGVAQIIVWFLYAWFVFTIFYKPMPDGGYI